MKDKFQQKEHKLGFNLLYLSYPYFAELSLFFTFNRNSCVAVQLNKIEIRAEKHSTSNGVTEIQLAWRQDFCGAGIGVRQRPREYETGKIMIK